ncbi:PREDICTED: 7-methylguanosine phosphate-specific 5'-nucleotidase [Polistes canadensis]|uniref:7-methylguanosine phosphate-specific 5'-nucleotidase n=1 Tax=Polistes canadensis TaxID=91411 RepID=UPI000718C65F|nr:PREDICTED: 7-methylguanosine phosphate-specific 5'-nucleotidase [Polistes canadensis]XP_014604724.1 PREDICTED: 7-methylguanosine phosphate-specific 5'-nucleotidase [Polistes canadensis]
MPDKITIDDFPIFKSKHVYIKDKNATMNTINIMLRDGPDNLQVVTDFDLTLTKQHVDGKLVLSSFGLFGKCNQLPSTYTNEAKRLYQKYRPIEIDPNLALEEKIEAMSDWMTSAEKLLKGIEFDPKELSEVVQKYGTPLRDGTKELLEKLNEANIPVLVFSAGLGDAVEAVLKCHKVLFNNVKIISNFLKYNGNQIDGFKNKKLIHVFNKNEHALEQDYFKVIEGRRHVLLMGDNTGDANMVDGMDDTVAVLKIGFLYDKAEENLHNYMNEFDIVLVDDQTMQVATEILRTILK